jgi:hypothetical protein
MAEAHLPPARPLDALKARATRWLIAAFVGAVAIGQATGWIAGAKSPQVLRLCLFVPFLILGASMIAIDVRLRFAAARYFISPHWTYLLLNRDVGLASRGIHAWMVGAVFVAIALSELVFHAFSSQPFFG